MRLTRRLRDQARRVPPLAADGLLAVAIFALDLAHRASVINEDPTAAADPHALGYLLVALMTLPLVLRRRFPRAVLVTILAVLTGYLALGNTMQGVGESLLIGAYTVHSLVDTRAALPIHAGFAAMLAVGVVTARTAVPPVEVIGVIALYAGACWLGASVRTRRRFAEELELRAAQLERARQELAERAVTEERLRIARELHDVVAHSMSVIAVQSGVAAHITDTQPAAAKQALTDITVTSRAALNEIRRLLGVLRKSKEPAGDRAPLAGLGDLGSLAGSVRQAGVPVSVRITGESGPVPAAVDLSAYRIVQEALTNVLRHVPGASATVTINYGRHDMTVEVCDDGGDGTSTAVGTGGNGIVGMRERVALFGGEFHAGPTTGGGFRVHARLPYREEQR